jgi:serine/threonine-protein kinase HSL1, negative regulator of Swe1 kinase
MLTKYPRPNYEKLFYNALLRFRIEQSENYPGFPLGYSASDYHHAPRPVPKPSAKQIAALRSRNHNRRRSQYSIISEEGGKRDSYYKDPVTATSTTTKGSYDPYRSSRTPIVSSNVDHATVVVRQISGASSSRKASHATSLRHAAPNRLHPQAYANSIASSRDYVQASQQRAHSSGTGHSRSSLASSRRSEAGMHKSVSYKRQVSFQHMGRRASINSSRRGPVRLVSSDTESCKGNTPRQALPESQSSPSLPTPPRLNRQRKPIADFDMKKARAANSHWKDEARKVSSELGKICEEAFNRSSVSSSNVSQKNRESPATSVSVHGENVPMPLSNQLKNRPLPQPPPESSHSYTMRELTETRRRLLEHCQTAGSDVVPLYLSEVIAHLDRLMQPAMISENEGKRSASDPHPASTRKPSHLAAIHEESQIANNPQEAQSNRSASDPLKPTKQGPLHDPSRTIRLVSPEVAPHPQLPPIQPLNIRKKSLTPVNSLRAASTESLRGTMDRSGYDPRLYGGGLDTIEEYPKAVKNKDLPGSPGGARKWSWFKRQSEVVEDMPPPPPLKNSPPKAKKPPTHAPSASHASSHDSTAITNSTEDKGGTVEMVPALHAKKKWFSKMFGKVNKNTGVCATEHVIVQDAASETDSAAASTDNLLAEPRENKMDGNTWKASDPEFDETETMPATLANSGGNRAIYITQNWFARFFHIKPATRVICLSMSKAKARKEIMKILKEWRKYGLRDVACQRSGGADTISGRVDSMNCKRSDLLIWQRARLLINLLDLHLKPVNFHARLFTVLERGRRCNLSVMRFTQEQGAASSFYKVVDTLEVVLKERDLLVSDSKRRKGIELSMKESGL